MAVGYECVVFSTTLQKALFEVFVKSINFKGSSSRTRPGGFGPPGVGHASEMAEPHIKPDPEKFPPAALCGNRGAPRSGKFPHRQGLFPAPKLAADQNGVSQKKAPGEFQRTHPGKPEANEHAKIERKFNQKRIPSPERTGRVCA
ncbi:MAG: hypothetical protein V3S29_13385 [bacterium]